MHDPASDVKKPSGSVQAASGPAPKPNPVQGVFVVDKDARGRLRAKFVPVTTGITGATDIEVLSGLNEKQEIVSGPYKTLRDLKGGSLLKRDTVKVVLPSGSSS
jgi:HlyD family secretion protein